MEIESDSAFYVVCTPSNLKVRKQLRLSFFDFNKLKVPFRTFRSRAACPPFGAFRAAMMADELDDIAGHTLMVANYMDRHRFEYVDYGLN